MALRFASLSWILLVLQGLFTLLGAVLILAIVGLSKFKKLSKIILERIRRLPFGN